VKLAWENPDNADGCNILWGIAPDKLYNCRQTNGIEELEMHCLNAGTDYYIALEAFGRGGVARRSELCFIPTNDGKRD